MSPRAIVSDNEEENTNEEVGCSVIMGENERELITKRWYYELLRLCHGAGRWKQKQQLRQHQETRERMFTILSLGKAQTNTRKQKVKQGMGRGHVWCMSS